MNHESPYYRPMMTLSLMFDTQFASAKKLFSYHFTNLLLHCLCCVSLLWLLTLLGAGRVTAFWWVLVFAVHPIIAHTVLWIPARSDIMVTLFGILFFCLYLKCLRKPTTLLLVINVFLFGAAMFSKESAVFLTFMALILGYSLRHKFLQRNLLLVYAGWVAVLVTWYFLRISAVNLRPDSQVGFASFLSNIPFPAEILVKFFFPLKITVLPVYSMLYTVPGVIIFFGLIYLLWSLRRPLWPIGFLGIAWFLVFIVPNMLVRLATAGDDFEYLNHRAYLPLAGLTIFLVMLTPEVVIQIKIPFQKYWGPVLIMILALFSLFQEQKYTDAEHFWASAIHDTPSRAWYHYYQGRFFAATKDYDHAEKSFQTALSIKEYPRFWYELGLLYYWSGNQKEKAFNNMQKAVAKKYREPSALKNFSIVSSETGRMFFEKGEYTRAAERGRIALAYDSSNPALYYNLGIYYMYTGEKEKAPLQWRRALKYDPEMTACYKNLYLFYQDDSAMKDSVRYFKLEYNKRIAK